MRLRSCEWDYLIKEKEIKDYEAWFPNQLDIEEWNKKNIQFKKNDKKDLSQPRLNC